MRVVSLLPSATETLFALGVEPVAVSHECDHPPAARDLPAANRARVDGDAASAAIDEQVAAAERDGGVYEIDLDVLARVDPDLVVTQGVCEVCAVDGVLVREALSELDCDAEVLTLDPHTLDDVLSDVERVGRAVDAPDRAASLVASLRDRVAAVEARVAGADRPSTVVLDWLDPVMVAGHWAPDLVERAGGDPRLAETGEHSGPVEWAAVRRADPDVLVAAPCGFDLEQTAANAGDLTDREGWAALDAVRGKRAWAFDGQDYLNRPGPRLVDTLEYLAAVLHPSRFDAPPRDAVRRVDDLPPTDR